MADLAQFRTALPELKGLNDLQAVDYISKKTGVDRNSLMADMGIQDTSLGQEVIKGAARGVDQLQGTGYAGAGWLGSAAGIDAVRDFGLRGLARNQQEAAENAAAVASYEDVHGVGDALNYLAGGVGEALPQLIPGLGSAGIGAKVAAKAATLAAAKQGLEKTAAKKLVADAVGRGAMQGGAAYGIGSETANIYGDIHDKTGEDHPWVALGHGIPAGLVEGLAERTVLKDMMKGRPKGMSRKAYIAQTAAKDYLTEGVLEELPQTVIEQAAVKAVDPNQQWDVKDMIDSTLKGGIGGGIMGAGSAMITPQERSPGGGSKNLREIVTDGIVDLGGAIGTKGADILETAKDKELEANPAAAAAFEKLNREKNAGRLMLQDFDDYESKLPDAEKHELISGRASADADHILASPETSTEEKDLAAKFKAGHMKPVEYQAARIAMDKAKNRTGFMEGMVSWMKGKSKDSLVRTQRGEESYQLAKLWQREHGSKVNPDLFDDSEDGHNAAASLMEWVRSGYGAEHNDGKAMIPEQLIEQLGDKAHTAVESASAMLGKQGLLSEKAARRTPAILKRVRESAQGHSNDHGIVENLLKPLANDNWDAGKTKTVVDFLRSSKGEVSPTAKAELKKHFNDVDKLLEHFVPKEVTGKYAKGWKEKSATELASDEEGNVILSDEAQEKEVAEYGSGYNVASPEDKSKLFGPTSKGVTRPYNLGDEREVENHKRVVDRHTGEAGTFIKSLGAWDHAKRNVEGDELHAAENDLIAIYGSKLSDNKDTDGAVKGYDKGVNPDDLSPGERKAMLHRINRQFKYVEVETADSGDSPKKLSKNKVQELRSEYVRNERRDESKETPENGYLYLERMHQGKPTLFPVHTQGLLKHTWGVEKVEARSSDEVGAHMHRNQVTEAINDIITSDDSFTGKIMHRDQSGQLVEMKALPENLKLGRSNVAEANKLEAKARREEAERSPFAVRYAETPAEKKSELMRLVNVGHGRVQDIVAAISKGAPAVNLMYNDLRNQWHGEVEGFGGTPRNKDIEKQIADRRAFNRNNDSGNNLVDTTTDKDIVPSEAKDAVQTGIRREDPAGDKPIQRGPDGAAVGLGSDAAFAGYGGNSRGGEGTHTEPVAKTKRKLGDQSDARDWVADMLLKGVPAYKAARMKYAADNEVSKRIEAGVRELAKMSVQGLTVHGFSKAEADTILSRLNALKVGQNDSQLVEPVHGAGEAGVRGQLNEVGGRGAAEVRAAGDQREKSTNADVGEDNGEDLQAFYRQLEKSKRVDPASLPGSYPVWSLYKGDDSGDTRGAPVAVFSDMGVAQNMAERDGLTLVNELARDAVKNSKFSDQQSTNNPSSAEAQQAAKDFLTSVLGPKVKTIFADLGGKSGSWTRKDGEAVIKLAINGDVLSTAFHESFHEFMDVLGRNGGKDVVDALRRVASNPRLFRELQRRLAEHPEAQKQLSDPDEAAAYMFQFWRAGQLTVGPETKTLFERIKGWINKALGLISDSYRQQNAELGRTANDTALAEAIMSSFSEGHFADDALHAEMVKQLTADTQAVNKANENINKALEEAMSKYGKLVFSAEAMMELTKNPYMISIARSFNQKAGEAMRGFKNGALGSFFDATRSETDRRMNQLKNVLTKYEAADLELARAFMSKRSGEGYKGPNLPTDPVSRQIVAELDTFFEGMGKYIADSGITRLEMHGGRPVWEKIAMRKNYWPRVFDYDVLREQADEFKADLLKHHGGELQKLADQANEEIAASTGAGANTASATQLEKGPAERETVTKELIADAIWMRSMNNGTLELDETTSNLGITPAASAVNRRQLTWLDAEAFDKYMSKDVANIVTNYTRSIVKRGEYQKRFGNGGEKIAEAADKAFLHELGGKDLVERATEEMPNAQEAWYTQDPKTRPAFPTLRQVGFDMHRADVGMEAHNQAVIDAHSKLDQSLKAVQAMEGTLGNNISPELRQFNSWAVTYQNFRLLSTMLFTSMQDVNGVVINGGNMKDAWDTFVGGMKGVRDSLMKVNGQDALVEAAEMWGTVDAGTDMDAIGNTYGSIWMSGKAKKFSDAFFKYTGAEGWNRGIRSVATNVATRIIKNMATDPSYQTDPAKKAQFERLFGKGASPADIKMLANGELDPSDQANIAAVNRWVLDAVPAPNAAHRPIWGSDPHYQTFIHLKNYTYTWHRTIMLSCLEQARLGNLRPALVAAIGYMPIVIAAGAVKGLLMPGDEPAWMKGGLGGYLKYGVSVAGLGGVPQMYGTELAEMDVAKVLGPMWDQLQDASSVPIPAFAQMRDHTAIGETLGALPGGNMWKRWSY